MDATGGGRAANKGVILCLWFPHTKGNQHCDVSPVKDALLAGIESSSSQKQSGLKMSKERERAGE